MSKERYTITGKDGKSVIAEKEDSRYISIDEFAQHIVMDNSMPKTTGGQIQLLAQGYTELEQKVNDIPPMSIQTLQNLNCRRKPTSHSLRRLKISCPTTIRF